MLKKLRKIVASLAMASLFTGLFPLQVLAQTQNLLTYSQNFDNAAWTKTNLQSFVTGVADPFGGTNAQTMVENNTTAAHYVSQGEPAAIAGVPATFSVFVKSHGGSWIFLSGRTGGGGAWFNIVTGALGGSGNISSYGVENYGNGWFRCYITYTTPVAGLLLRIYGSTGDGVTSYAGRNAAEYDYFGAQVDIGTQMSPYRRVDATPYEKSAYNFVSQKQNLQINSENLSAWTNNAIASVTTSGTTPNGNTAFSINENGANSTHYLAQTPSSISIGQTRTFSLVAKAVNRSYIALTGNHGSNGYYFNVSNGTIGSTAGVGTSGGGNIVPIGNGWYKVWITYTASSLSSASFIYLASADNTASYTGTNGSSAVLIGDVQDVIGNWPGGYAQTLASTFNEGNLHSVVAQGQNISKWSNDLTQGAYWVPQAGAAGLSYGVTAPDGTATASAIDLTACGANAGIYSTASASSFVGKTMTISSWIRSANGGNQTMKLTEAIGGVFSNTITVTPTWARYSLTFVPTVSGIGIWFQSAGATGAIQVWGAQITQANWAGPYKPTAASVFNVGNIYNIATQRQNLVTYSEQIDNAAYTKSNLTVSTNQITAPDGNVTAEKFTDSNDGGSVAHLIDTGTNKSTKGSVNTFSIYAKAGTKSIIEIYSDAGTAGTAFNVSTGQYTSHPGANPISSSITNVGNGWYRCSVTFLGFGFETRVYLENVTSATSYQGDGTGTIYLWGAQNVISNWAGQYTPTTSATVNNGNIYNAAAQGQNLVQYSQDLTNAYWSKQFSTITGNDGTAPDGTVTAQSVVEDNTTNIHGFFLSLAGSASDNQTYTWSVYAKANAQSWIQVAAANGNAGVYFNLSNGTKGSTSGSIVSSRITSVGNGWYRCSVTFVYSSASPAVAVYSATGDAGRSYLGTLGQKAVYLWGMQFVQANWPGPYTPTTSAAVNNGNIYNLAY